MHKQSNGKQSLKTVILRSMQYFRKCLEYAKQNLSAWSWLSGTTRSTCTAYHCAWIQVQALCSDSISQPLQQVMAHAGLTWMRYRPSTGLCYTMNLPIGLFTAYLPLGKRNTHHPTDDLWRQGSLSTTNNSSIWEGGLGEWVTEIKGRHIKNSIDRRIKQK